MRSKGTRLTLTNLWNSRSTSFSLFITGDPRYSWFWYSLFDYSRIRRENCRFKLKIAVFVFAVEDFLEKQITQIANENPYGKVGNIL